MRQIREVMSVLPTVTSGKIHICHECNKHDVWSHTWQWFGSLKDLDDGTTTKFCSEACAVAWTERTGAKADDMSTPQNPY
jgi:hypothetical protein